MELQQARYFLALAQSLNFTHAAERCGVSQPTLTKAIQKLERELNGALIHRERQLTQLTDLGKLVLPMIERTLAAADSVRFHAREFQNKGIAPLRIAFEPSISAALVVGLLSELSEAFPGLQVDLLETAAEALPAALLNGVASAAIASDFDGLSSRIKHWCLFEERLIVLASPDSVIGRQGQRAPLPTDALGEALWLERIGGRELQRLWMDHFPESRELRIAHRGGHESHLQHMAAAGLGVMLAPEHAPYLPSLVACRIADDSIRREVSLLVVGGRRYSPALDAFIKLSRLRDWKTAARCGSRTTAPTEAVSGGTPVSSSRTICSPAVHQLPRERWDIEGTGRRWQLGVHAGAASDTR